MRTNSIKLSFVYILSLLAIVSCLQEERSPEEILVPSPAQVETSDASLMLTSKVPSGSEKLVQECGFYYSKDKSMADTRKVAGVLAANIFTAELPDRTYGTTYYICAYVTNGHGSEIRSDLRTFQLEELEEYVEFGQVNMVSFDPSSKQLMITIDTDIWAGVSVSEAGVCYGAEPTSLSIEGDHKEGVYRSETRAEAGVIEILLNNFSEATQYYLRPYVKDGDYFAYGEVVPFYIPAVAKVSTFDAEAVTASGATLSGEVTDECGSAVTERGFAWIEGDAVPTIEDSHMAAGSGLGAMTATVEGLDPNKKYTFRAYATNASGTAYGEAKVFTTLVALPSLAASTISNITSTSATFNGVLANNGGESVSEVGFYYSTEKEVNPETAEKVSLEYSTYQKSAKELSANTLYSAIQSAQAAASDEGEAFSIDVYNLGIKTKYYVKSYAVNSAGVAYGSVLSFETAGEIATIKTVGSSEVTTSSAVLSANITTDNGEKITERGFVWMEGTGNPTTDSNKLKVSGEVGEYTATLEGLDPNKKYSFRAYAINAEGTAYGDVMSFTTKVALPALSNVVIPSLSSTTATLTSKVTYHGGETVTEVGFYYSTESDVDPETSQKVSRIYSEDTFSIEVANLGINTKYYVKAYAINSAGTAYSEINSFKTESSVPSVQTIGVADITPESALLSGSVLSDNGASITERGFVWIQGDGTPTVDSHKLTATGTTGEFTSSLTGLEPNKKYSFRAYATNSKGTAYGEIMTFSTVAGLPALSSVDVSAITSTSATFASTVTDHGGETVSEVGFYYSTDETVDPATSVKITQKYAKDAFTSQIADLAIFTKYYVKAYATNSAGTAYSDVVEFKTLASTPVVNTLGSSDITFNSATLSGKVLTDNGAAITERGFVWIKGEGTPTTSSNKVKVDGATGDYTALLSDLEPNVTYSYRAYAVNELGTSYGAVMKFETIKGLPTLGPVNVSNVTSTAASFSGSVTGHGGETVSEIGFYYSTDAAVDPSSSVKVNLTYSSDSFSSSVSGLAVNTKYYVKSYARNSVGTVYSGVISFTTLADVPVVNTVGSSDVTSNSAVLSGKVVTDNGATITERGFVWVQGEGTPTTSSLKLTTTGTTGDFSATIKDLAPNQKYSFRAYAINSVGTSYGETKSFTTSVTKPSLNPVTFSSITSTSATFSSKVSSHGGATVTEVGFYYSTDSTVDPDKSLKVNRTYTSDSFSISVSELAINTKYYVKAYAVNSAGTVYSDIASFTTLASTPVVNTVGSSEISSTGAVLSGTVVTDNGAAITERGFVYMLGEGSPTTSSQKLTVSGTTGDFTASLKDLEPNKKYSFRAYAVNSVGTSYGGIMTFTTGVAKASLSATGISDITSTSATLSSKVTSHGGDTVSEVGFYYSTEETVDPDKSHKVNRTYSSDSFSISISELAINTKYYVKAYAVNSAGTVYSDVASFTTLASTPVVNTVGSSDISSTGAVLSGTVVTDNGATITERGFVWLKGTDAPTTSSNKVKVEGATGDFTATISGLDPNQKYSFRAYAINSKGTAYGDIMTFNTVAGLPALSAMKVSSITTTSATFTCTVTNHGGETVSEVGFYYSKEESVDVETAQKISEVYSSDAFTLKAEDLEIGQNYYVKAYTKNSIGEVYSAVVSFKTTSTVPSVSTIGYTKLSATSAELSGEVTDDNGENIFERGFVWIKGTSTPTTSHNKLPAFADVGEYAVLFEGIEPNQVYSYRAYAINSIGTAYGDVMQLQINVSLPVVTTNDVTGITNTSATSGGVIYSDGGGEILSKGVVWSMRENPTVESSNMTNDGEGNSAFASHITDLCQGLTYYVRAYATNIMGTVYGEEKQFTTTGEIQGTPLEASNSFIISAPGTYTFQTVKGNSTESVGSVASAEVLWESFGTDEKPEIGSVVSFAAYNNGKIGFAPSDRFREGNAVIAAKDASGTILWSWHIWLTDQPQEHIYPNNAGTMMDRNLGATSATPGDAGALGLLYQWGRKDPFLGGSSVDCFDVVAKSTIAWPEKENCTTATGTVAYAIEHPTTFITDSQDWCYTEGYSHHDYTRWKSDKTIYDPCPVGWRVPDGGESGVWNISGVYDDYTYDSSDKSMIFYIYSPDVTCYPASGYRDYYGELFGVGYYGYYWSVKPSIEEYDLSFQNANLFPPTDGLSLAEAHSVRCQKEGTGGGFKYDNNFSTSGAKSLSDAGTANSYIVSSAGTYSIPAVKGNSSESVGSIASAEVLWETFGTDEKVFKGSLVSGAKYENGKVYFKTADSYREGNAVIAAKDASGTILWSWHIWLTDQPQEQTYYNNAGTMMDRNLGATSATPGDVGALGLLYQWGRKDPFLGSSSIYSCEQVISTGSWTIKSSGKYDANPMTFYTNQISSSDDWGTQKTINDPCPAGWRVPDGDGGVWAIARGSSSYYPRSFDNINKGINFSGDFGNDATIWYPASGYLDSYDGNLAPVGDYGCYWSCTPDPLGGDDSYFLSFNSSGSVFPFDNFRRAVGGSVRCFKEGSEPVYDIPKVEMAGVIYREETGYPDAYGTIIDNGGSSIIDAGFIYGTDPDLTSSSVTVVNAMYFDNNEIYRELAIGPGTYYIQAYATNLAGTGYSEIIKYVQDAKLPTVEITGVDQMGAGIADAYARVSNDGGDSILELGFIYDTTPDLNPATAKRVTVPYSGDVFWYSFYDLKPNTYYIQAYATTSAGTAYSDMMSFNILLDPNFTATDLASAGTANSYIVSSYGTYSFPAVKGNSFESVGSVATSEVLWESFGTSKKPSVGDLIDSVQYYEDKIVFSTNDSYKEGNAVIAAKDANGTILWSWHIWLTDQPQEQVYYNNAGTMMDRNLGATSATPGDVGALGLLYQWGRKDPFLGSSSISESLNVESTISWPDPILSDSFTGTLNFVNENPTIFILATLGDSEFDWHYPYRSDNLWDNNKTIYDPCPSGWRVPSGGDDGVWSVAGFKSSGSTTENHGQLFDIAHPSTTWYPFAGFRTADAGELFAQGTEGLYWSTTTAVLADMYYYEKWMLSINSNGVNNYSCFRARANSVRCQKEGTGGGLKYDNDFSTSGARSLSDAGTANSYIVSTAGTYSISAVKGNSSESVGSVASAEVLWESFGTDEKVFKGDLVSGAKYENGKIYFKTADSYREGNAVVAAKDQSGTILWSWHIWLTDQPQEQVYNNYAGTIMDRNLGATSATPGDVGALGLLYQWGRKDPFLGSSLISNDVEAKSTLAWPSAVSSDSSTGTVDYVTTHPTTYVTAGSPPYDWHYSSRDNSLWMSSKSIYDPCPVGWRVPDGKHNGIWSTAAGTALLYNRSYDLANNGMNFSSDFGYDTTIWYPASGYIDTGNGMLGLIGIVGNYWSVTTIDKYIYILTFNNDGSVYTSEKSLPRANGYSVRCVKEASEK